MDFDTVSVQAYRYARNVVGLLDDNGSEILMWTAPNKGLLKFAL